MPRTDVTVFSVDAGEPGVVDATVQLTGVEAKCEVSALSAAGGSDDINVNLVGVEAKGEAGTLTAFGQGTPGTLGFPRTAAYAIGGVSAWAVNHSLGEYMREGLALLDCVILGMNSAIITDQDQGNGMLSRQNIINDLKARNPDLQIFDYTDLMETSNSYVSGTSGRKCYDEAGPVGAQLFWDTQNHGELRTSGSSDPGGTDLTPTGPYASTGIPISDWWARISNGTKKSTFTSNNSPYNVNLCPAFVQPDSQGRFFSQYYFDEHVQPDNLEPHQVSNGGSGIGPDGIGIYIDVIDHKPRTDRIDWNGDGSGDSSRTVFDAHNSGHQNDPATLAGGGVNSAGQWRLGQRDYFNAIKAAYPGITIIGNLSLWPNQFGGTGIIPHDVQPEYQVVPGTSVPPTNVTPREAMIQGGIVEGKTQQVSEFNNPVTGVMSDGRTNFDVFGNTFPGETKGWQTAYNEYRYIVEIAAEPKLSALHFEIRGSNRLADTPNGRQTWDHVPDPSTPFHLLRWMLCTTLLDNGYCCPEANAPNSNAGRKKGAFIFDEFGTINQATTGLSRGWLGQPLEGPVTVPFGGSGDHRLFKREYEFGLNIVTTSKTNNLLIPVSAIGGAGVWKRINGVQDPVWNDGSTVNGDIILPPIDGIILQRI